MWHVEYTDEFWLWWLGLTEDQREALDDRVTLLAEKGPNLKRPVVGGIRASRHPNMKELRVSEGGSLRVLFAFDPRRRAILLLVGCKSGRWNAWSVGRCQRPTVSTIRTWGSSGQKGSLKMGPDRRGGYGDAFD